MPDDSINNDEPQRSRRDFFRLLMLRGIEGGENTVQGVSRRVERLIAPFKADAASARSEASKTPELPDPPQPRIPNVGDRLLRPPGAIREHDFASTCSRCGQCAAVCPAQCIVLNPDIAGGTPFIVARESPCVVCTDLACTKHCPSGALQRLDDPAEIRMGLAIWDKQRCVRAHGEDCDLCVTQCPIGETAIRIDDAGGITVDRGCTGCGVCERACPTEPASIVVEPDQQIIA